MSFQFVVPFRSSQYHQALVDKGVDVAAELPAPAVSTSAAVSKKESKRSRKVVWVEWEFPLERRLQQALRSPALRMMMTWIWMTMKVFLCVVRCALSQLSTLAEDVPPPKSQRRKKSKSRQVQAAEQQQQGGEADEVSCLVLMNALQHRVSFFLGGRERRRSELHHGTAQSGVRTSSRAGYRAFVQGRFVECADTVRELEEREPVPYNSGDLLRSTFQVIAVSVLVVLDKCRVLSFSSLSCCHSHVTPHTPTEGA
jgi:hypothetical protein